MAVLVAERRELKEKDITSTQFFPKVVVVVREAQDHRGTQRHRHIHQDSNLFQITQRVEGNGLRA
ncbi:hypothetical protein E2C01_074322 [Portunus trituberculatus]|uniref:Uncharacterized protein n=1 Tax=Portunus trituberculatus TaxID=210409 RepID=A0A5B7ICX2_PORTR|nr:hypothetical protein [Portunus trituberculatus]